MRIMTSAVNVSGRHRPMRCIVAAMALLCMSVAVRATTMWPRTFLETPYQNAEEWCNDQLLAGELERRLDRFEAAAQRFTALLADDRASQTQIRRVASYQLELIAAKDNLAHAIPAAPR